MRVERRPSSPLRPRALALALCLAMHALGCGYRPLASSTAPDPLGPFVVVGGPALVSNARAIAAAEQGARSELARLGQLASCSASSTSSDASCASVRVSVEILRIEESPEGIAEAPLFPSPTAGSPPGMSSSAAPGGRPLARGLRLTVTGRASLRSSRGGAVLRATADVRAAETIARGRGPSLDPAVFELDRDEAIRAAAAALGARLVRRLLGVPDASDEE